MRPPRALICSRQRRPSFPSWSKVLHICELLPRTCRGISTGRSQAATAAGLIRIRAGGGGGGLRPPILRSGERPFHAVIRENCGDAVVTRRWKSYCRLAGAGVLENVSMPCHVGRGLVIGGGEWRRRREAAAPRGKEAAAARGGGGERRGRRQAGAAKGGDGKRRQRQEAVAAMGGGGERRLRKVAKAAAARGVGGDIARKMLSSLYLWCD